ncbi:MAG: M67 family metallopeptidase [bacterium]|nr:M67 family metallopeptidase [bacterium]
MLMLRAADLDAIFQQALQEYPGECCGILTTGAGGDLSAMHKCRNLQDELHAKDPEQYPRDARTAYFIDSGELFRIVNGAEKSGGGVSGFYHSHVDCDAYFSQEDKDRAMAWDEPAYPDAVYLVVSVYGDERRGYKAFSWDDGHADFIEVEIAVQP